jgi:hypothetical protein
MKRRLTGKYLVMQPGDLMLNADEQNFLKIVLRNKINYVLMGKEGGT